MIICVCTCVCVLMHSSICVCVLACVQRLEENLVKRVYYCLTLQELQELNSGHGKAPLSAGPSHLPKLTVSKADSERGITSRDISGVLRMQHILGDVGESIQNPLSNQEAHTDHSTHLVHSCAPDTVRDIRDTE